MTTKLKQPTKQKAYEQIREYFTRPDAIICYDGDSGACVYRLEGWNGQIHACAVGCLIPDNLINSRWDVLSETADTVAKDLGWSVPFGEWLKKIQRLHDNSESTEYFIERLDSFAREYKLKIAGE